VSEKFSIFGGTGFIGRRLAQRLQEAGHETYVMSRNHDFSVKDSHLGHLIYAAGVTGNRFITDRFNTVEVHVSKLNQLLSTAEFESLTYLSTCRIHERSMASPESVEEFLVNPGDISDFYNLSKLLGEAMVLQSTRRYVRVVRLAYVVDLAEDSRDEVVEWWRQAQIGRLHMQCHPHTEKNYVILDEVCRAVTDIALSRQGGVFEVASEQNVRMIELGELFQEQSRCMLSFAPDMALRAVRKIDISRAKIEVGFKPTPLVHYLRHTLELTAR